MKDLKISRELLSEILKLEVVKHSLYNKRNNTFNITYMQSDDSLKANWMPVNVYEFAFKCKDWAFKKGYEIHSNFREVVAIFKEVRKIENVGHFKRLPLLSWEEIEYERDTNTEVEAIIKACEWILSEANK